MDGAGILAYITVMRERAKAQGLELIVPPPSAQELGGEFISGDPNKYLTVRFPFQERFRNPVGLFQGGMLCACLDEVFGPLSYMASGGPTVTLQMSTAFVKAFKASDKYVEITAKIEQRTKQLLFMSADVKTPNGELVATAQTQWLILGAGHLQKFKED